MNAFQSAVNIAIMIMSLLTTTSAGDACSFIRLSGHLSRKIGRAGDAIKLSVNIKNLGTTAVDNVNLRIDLPPGAQYVGSHVMPNMKSRSKPINLEPQIYWTDFTMRKKKSQSFIIKVKCMMEYSHAVDHADSMVGSSFPSW